jgi:hypothetical protein
LKNPNFAGFLNPEFLVGDSPEETSWCLSAWWIYCNEEDEMKSGEQVHFESKWWKSNKAKTLRGSKGETLTLALNAYERGRAVTPHDLGGLMRQAKYLGTAFASIDKAVKKTLQECDPRFHRQTLDVLMQFPGEIKKRKKATEAVLTTKLSFGVMGHSMLRKVDDDSGIVPYIKWLCKQNLAQKQKFMPAVDRRLKHLQENELKVIQDAVRGHKQLLSKKQCSTAQTSIAMMGRNLRESRKLVLGASKYADGTRISAQLALIGKKCEAIMAEANRTKMVIKV